MVASNEGLFAAAVTIPRDERAQRPATTNTGVFHVTMMPVSGMFPQNDRGWGAPEERQRCVGWSVRLSGELVRRLRRYPG